MTDTRPADGTSAVPVLAANPGNLFDDVGIGKVARPAPPLAVNPTTDTLVLEAIDLIEGNLRAAPEVTPRASLLCAVVVAGLAFSHRC